MISQGPEDIEITSFGPLQPLMDVRWEGSTAQNDPKPTLAAQQRRTVGSRDAPGLPGNIGNEFRMAGAQLVSPGNCS